MKKTRILVLIVFILLSCGKLPCLAFKENTSYVESMPSYVEEDKFHALKTEEKEEEFCIELPPELENEQIQTDLWIFAESEERSSCYYQIIEGRILETEDEHRIHIAKDQMILGVGVGEDSGYRPVPRLREKEQDGVRTWTNVYTAFLHNMHCDFLAEHQRAFLTIAQSKDGGFSYEIELDETENWGYTNGNVFCFAFGERIPTYTGNGVTKEYCNWDSSYVGVHRLGYENSVEELEFKEMSVKDFPETSFAAQLVVIAGGEYWTTELLTLQETSEEKEEVVFSTEQGELYCSVEDGEICLETYDGSDEVIIIPDMVDGKPVTMIREGCFAWGENISGFEVSDENQYFMSDGDNLYSKDGCVLYAASKKLSGEYTIPEHVEEIGDQAFYRHPGITSVVFPENLRRIGNGAFYEVTMSEIELPKNLEVIENEAFGGSALWLEESLAEIKPISVHIGKNVCHIGPGAFGRQCITEYVVEEDNPWYQSQEGLLLTKHGTYLLACPSGKSGTFAIPEGIVYTHSDAFDGNGDFAFLGEQYTGIVDMILPSSMKYFDVISAPLSLLSLTINSELESFDEESFSNGYIRIINEKDSSYVDGVLLNNEKTKIISYSPQKTDVEYRIPESVTEIDENAFDTGYLKKLIFPVNLTLADTSFATLSANISRMDQLTEIYVEEENAYFSSKDGVLFNKDGTVLIAYPANRAGQTYEVPDGVLAIAEDAFQDNITLSEITLPASVQSLFLEYDFSLFMEQMESLQTIHISADNPYYSCTNGVVVSKKENAVIYCLESAGEVLEIPPAERIESGIFHSENCFAYEVWIPEGMVYIGADNFSYFSQGDEWSDITIYIPESVEEIAKGTFLNSPDLTLVVTKGSYAEEYAKEYQISNKYK